MILLDEVLIRQHLKTKQYKRSLQFHLFREINSTNQFLKEISNCVRDDEESSNLIICAAEKQTQGRGRFGRTWHSPFGENIYFSSHWLLKCEISSLSGLSLVVGLAILACLKEFINPADLRIKWPNDILWRGKKLSGILIEILAETQGGLALIIGIGINVNTATEKEESNDLNWCSLYDISGKRFDRNQILANLIYHLDNYLTEYLRSGFKPFAAKWQDWDYLQGQLIQVSQANNLISGQVTGVNELGQLCLLDEKGIMHYLSSGETSISKA